MTTTREKLFETLQHLRGLHERECELEEILFAYDVAHHAHLTQKRDGGEDYISHPVEGCLMMARDFRIKNAALYVAFLLHDTGEDTTIFGDKNALPYWKFKAQCAARVTRLFGPRVAELVVTLTKPAVNNDPFVNKDEMMKFYLEGLNGDYQATMLKMVDRLHNLMTLPADNQKKVEKQVTETRQLLLPVFEKSIRTAIKVGDATSGGPMNALYYEIRRHLYKLKPE